MFSRKIESILKKTIGDEGEDFGEGSLPIKILTPPEQSKSSSISSLFFPKLEEAKEEVKKDVECKECSRRFTGDDIIIIFITNFLILLTISLFLSGIIFQGIPLYYRILILILSFGNIIVVILSFIILRKNPFFFLLFSYLITHSVILIIFTLYYLFSISEEQNYRLIIFPILALLISIILFVVGLILN